MTMWRDQEVAARNAKVRSLNEQIRMSLGLHLFREGTEREDSEEAADFTYFDSPFGTVASRVRDAYRRTRGQCFQDLYPADLSVRWRLLSGGDTEREKIIHRGKVKYIYTATADLRTERKRLLSYAILDAHEVRSQMLAGYDDPDQRVAMSDEIPNHDGESWFRIIDTESLHERCFIFRSKAWGLMFNGQKPDPGRDAWRRVGQLWVRKERPSLRLVDDTLPFIDPNEDGR